MSSLGCGSSHRWMLVLLNCTENIWGCMFTSNNWSCDAHQMSRLNQSHYLADCGSETTNKSDHDVVIIRSNNFVVEVDGTNGSEKSWLIDALRLMLRLGHLK